MLELLMEEIRQDLFLISLVRISRFNKLIVRHHIALQNAQQFRIERCFVINNVCISICVQLDELTENDARTIRLFSNFVYVS